MTQQRLSVNWMLTILILQRVLKIIWTGGVLLLQYMKRTLCHLHCIGGRTIDYKSEIDKLKNKQPATEQEKTDIEKEIARLEKERLPNEYYVPLNVLLEPFIGGESFAQGQGSGVNASFVNQRKAYMHRRGNQTFPYLNWVELIANRVATSTKKHMMNNAAQAFFEQMGDKEKSGLFFKEQTQLYTVEHIRDILIRHLAENKPDVHGVYEKYIAYLAVNQRKTSSTETQASFIKHIQGGAYDANAEARNKMALSFMQNSGVIEDIINNEEINIFNRAKALTKNMINNNIVMIMKNGQPKFYSVFDKELYDSLTNMEQDAKIKKFQRMVCCQELELYVSLLHYTLYSLLTTLLETD